MTPATCPYPFVWFTCGKIYAQERTFEGMQFDGIALQLAHDCDAEQLRKIIYGGTFQLRMDRKQYLHAPLSRMPSSQSGLWMELRPPLPLLYPFEASVEIDADVDVVVPRCVVYLRNADGGRKP